MERLAIYTIGVTISGLVILGVCLYYERHRRRDPNYRKKLKLRKEYERKVNELEKGQSAIADYIGTRREEDVIILHELQLGESLMLRGCYEEATQHFANAISVCSNPEKFLHTLKSCLDPTLYYMLLNALVKGYGVSNLKATQNDAFQNFALVRC